MLSSAYESPYGSYCGICCCCSRTTNGPTATACHLAGSNFAAICFLLQSTTPAYISPTTHISYPATGTNVNAASSCSFVRNAGAGPQCVCTTWDSRGTSPSCGVLQWIRQRFECSVCKHAKLETETTWYVLQIILLFVLKDFRYSPYIFGTCSITHHTEAHVQVLRDTNQVIPQPVAILLADARRKEEKRTAKRVANRKSACTSRARKKALVEEMTRTNARLKRQAMILALLPDLVIAITIDGQITFCSAQVSSLDFTCETQNTCRRS
jgi:PAS domain-containing protein